MRNRDKYRLAGFLERDCFQSSFGSMRGTVRIIGDIVSPTMEDDGTWWDADEDEELYGPLLIVQSSKQQ